MASTASASSVTNRTFTCADARSQITQIIIRADAIFIDLTYRSCSKDHSDPGELKCPVWSSYSVSREFEMLRCISTKLPRFVSSALRCLRPWLTPPLCYFETVRSQDRQQPSPRS